MSQQQSSNRLPWRLSWDAMFFILVWSAQFWSSEVSGYVLPTSNYGMTMLIHLTRVMIYDPFPAFLLLALLAYLGADLWLGGRRQFYVKLIAVWLTIIAFVLIPTGAAIIYRHNTEPHLYIHDGAIQTEEAIKFLLAGKNPYVESYAETPMGLWSFQEPGGSRNPALDHLPYMPFTFLSSIPLYLFSQAVLGWYDQRFMFLIMFLFSVLILLRIGRTVEEKLASIMVLTLNPLAVPFFIEGRNDILVSFWMLGILFFLQSKRVVWAGIMFACAMTSKQTVWFIVPFFVLYILQLKQYPRWSQRVAQCVSVLMPAVVLSLIFLAPFMIWDAGAFLNAVLSLPSGLPTASTLHAIRSLGLGGLVLGLGWIERSTDPFPFLWFQLLFGGLILGYTFYMQWHNNTLPQVFINYALLFIVFLFFARSFADNYLGFAMTWLILPKFIGELTDQSHG